MTFSKRVFPEFTEEEKRVGRKQMAEIYTSLLENLLNKGRTIVEEVGPLVIMSRRHTWTTRKNTGIKHRYELKITDTEKNEKLLFKRTKDFDEYFGRYLFNVIPLKRYYGV